MKFRRAMPISNDLDQTPVFDFKTNFATIELNHNKLNLTHIKKQLLSIISLLELNSRDKELEKLT